MNKREYAERARQDATLCNLGFTLAEAQQLRRVAQTLHREAERACGTDHGCTERDDSTGHVYWVTAHTGRRYRVRDMERGAERALTKVIAARNGRMDGPPLATYRQTDPRGAPLYIIRHGDVPEGEDVAAYYSRGICITGGGHA